MRYYVREQVLVRLMRWRGGCCDSCHDDADAYAHEGMYQLREIELGKGRYTEVCCRVGAAYDRWRGAAQ
jgi:hypothetical protein